MRTSDSVTIVNVEAIDRKLATGDIEELKKQTTSLMPADLQKLMTAADLVDVVEYLVTLRKVLPPRETADGHAPRVGGDIGTDRDVSPAHNRVGLRCRGPIGCLDDDLCAHVGGIGRIDGILERSWNEDVGGPADDL